MRKFHILIFHFPFSHLNERCYIAAGNDNLLKGFFAPSLSFKDYGFERMERNDFILVRLSLQIQNYQENHLKDPNKEEENSATIQNVFHGKIAEKKIERKRSLEKIL